MGQDRSGQDRWLSWVGVMLALALLVGAGVVWFSPEPSTEITIMPPQPTATPPPTATPAPILIYVTGEVMQPESQIMLAPGSRVQDALDAVGGVTDQADMSRVNPTQLLRDGDHIHVYALDSTADALALPTPGGGGLVYINTASLEELMTLPRIGETTAQNIIDYREQNGPFSSLEDLLAVPRVGEVTIEGLADLVSFD